jgi:protein-disulfide isomerase
LVYGKINRRRDNQEDLLKNMSKRDELRDKRRKQQQRTRIVWISLIAVLAVGIAALIIVPRVVESNTPIGTIATVVPDVPTQVNRNTAGNPNAPVKVTEYADYQCPACLQFEQNYYDTLIKTYVDTGKVFFTYMPFQVIGPESDSAAQAAYCAADQGKYWQMHDTLYANQGAENSKQFTGPRLKAMAVAAGLDANQFNSCYDSQKYASQVSQDQTSALALGLNSTPSFTLDGKLISWQNMSEILSAIQAATQGK